MKTWAFIYVDKGCDQEKHNTIVESPGLRTIIVGVDTIDKGCEVAKRLLEEECYLIELCGGFGVDGTNKVIEAVKGTIPIGYVDFFPKEREKLNKALQQ